MGDDGVKINSALLLQRLNGLYDHFSSAKDLYGGVSILQIAHGKSVPPPGEEPYAASLQKYLLGYEFPDTIMLLGAGKLTVHASAKKLDYIREAQALAASGRVTIDLVVREKGDANKPNTDAMVALIKAEGGRVGGFPADSFTGAAAESWTADLVSAGIEVVDVSKAIDAALAVKDDEALNQVRKAGHLSARVARNVFVAEMERVIDEEDKAATHTSLSTLVAESLDKLDSYKVPVDTDQFDTFVRPVVQSGGVYNVHVTKPDVAPTEAALTYDTIIFSMGLRYKLFGAALARTFFVDPTPAQQRVYDALLEAQASLIDKLRPGAVISQVVAAVREQLLNAPGMAMDAMLTRTFGGGIGLRASDKALVLSTKNETVVQPGMAFYVCIGLSGIPLTDGKAGTAMAKLNNYAILIADTVVVGHDGPVNVTEKISRERSAVSYTLDSEGADDEEEAPSRSKSARAGADGGRDYSGRSTRLAARKTETEADEEARKRRDEHQALLFEKKREQARRRGAGGAAGGRDEADELANAPDIDAYKSTSEYPKGGRLCVIQVDKAHDCVLVPMFGTLVPFHISTIKSVSKTEEGHKSFLRINFYSPGQAPGKDCPPSMQAALAAHPHDIYVRTLNFMARDQRNMNQVLQLIKAMQKNLRQSREAERLAANLVEQQKLIMAKDGKVPRMQELNMWPAISGRKTQGTLEAHPNGLRFVSNKGERVEIIYGNIKHAVFQPCEQEHIVLIHFHLRHPIMIGKKKCRDIQFFTEVVEASEAIDGRHRSDYDVDEFGEEERQRRIRIEMNKNFKRFVERVEEIAERDSSGFSKFEVPQRDLGFPGTPYREMVFIMPCTDCLVALVDKPPFVVSVGDIEHVHFERVIFNGKSFDMVIIFKPGTREKGEDEFVRVTAIPMKHLDEVKRWLDEVAEITFTEGVGSFAWKSLIDDIVRREDFYASEDEATGEPKPVGWDFLRGDDEEEEEEEVDEDDEYASEEDEEEEEEEDDEEFDEAVDDEEDDESDYDDEDDDDEGDDWDELERKAAADDKKRGRDEDEEDERRKRKAGSAPVKKARR